MGVSRTFQRSSLFPDATVLENVMLAALAHHRVRFHPFRPMDGLADARQAAVAALKAVGLAERAGDRACTLAHGQKRQLEIAMALAQKPRLLLLDEPLAGLSAGERRLVEELLLGLSRDLTVLLIEHDVDFAYRFADRITVLHYGEVLARGTPQEIRSNPAVQEVYVGRGERSGAQASPAVGPASAAPGLQVEGLQAGYGEAVVLEGISLEVRPGEVVALLGRNGMGKTTLLHSLMGLVSPRAGTVRLAGRDVTALSPVERACAGLALVPQGRRIFPDLTVEEQLVLGARRGRWCLEEVYRIFPRLRERRKAPGGQLSGGEQQMLAIGRALMRNPSVLLMDEPSEGLSPLMIRLVRDVVADLRAQGQTILLAEQNVDLALSVADRVYVIERGQVVYHGTAAQLADDPEVLRRRMSV